MHDETQFFFVHLQKTAGTALWRRLKSEFAPDEVYPGPTDGEPPATVLSVEHLRACWQQRHGEIRIVTGHFPLCTSELLGGRFVTLTLLRDPVERTLSYLRHHRETTPADREVTLESIYDDPVRFELVHNHMVKMLSMTAAEMTDGAMTHIEFTPERLRHAKDRLHDVDVVGFQEDFSAFCEELSARYGWDLGDPIFMNRTEPVDVDAAFRARIARDNALDVELFDYARDALARRR
jgi:hypothetical protein